MEKRKSKIIIHASGGTAGKGGNTYKQTLPSAWMKELGINADNREVELCFDGQTITISKAVTLDEFISQKSSIGHNLLRLSYFDGSTLCSTIAVDMTDQTLTVQDHITDVIKTAFGNNVVPTWKDLQLFLEDRCIPRARAGLRQYLNTIGVEEYNPMKIVRKTEGRMAEDNQWLRIEALP